MWAPTKSLFWTDFWVTFPWRGYMAKWSKMTEGTGGFETSDVPIQSELSYVDQRLSVPVEKVLYLHYTELLSGSTISERDFRNARDFLKLSHQSGRKPMALWIWAFLIILTVAEAIGTGVLVAPLLSQAMTPHLALIVGIFIAAAIAGATLFYTHGAGDDIFKNSLLSKVRHSYRQNQGFRRADGSRAGDVPVIQAGEDQTKDEQNDTIARLAARIGATSLKSMSFKYGHIVIAVLFILGFGIATAGIRYFQFNRDQDVSASESMSSSTPSDYAHLFGGHETSDHNAEIPLPDEVSNAAKKSSDQEKRSITSDTLKANTAGIILLAIIYGFTQLLGVLTGYKYSFYDNQAYKAYRATWGEMTYEGFLRLFVEPVCKRGELRLRTLQSKLAHANPNYRRHSQSFDFLKAYLEEVRNRAEPLVSSHIPQAAVSEPRKTVEVPSGRSAPVVQLVTENQRVPLDSLDYDAIASTILNAEKADRKVAIADAVRVHGLNPEQQAMLAEMLKRARSQSKTMSSPTVSQALLDAADED